MCQDFRSNPLPLAACAALAASLPDSQARSPSLSFIAILQVIAIPPLISYYARIGVA